MAIEGVIRGYAFVDKHGYSLDRPFSTVGGAKSAVTRYRMKQRFYRSKDYYEGARLLALREAEEIYTVEKDDGY